MRKSNPTHTHSVRVVAMLVVLVAQRRPAVAQDRPALTPGAVRPTTFGAEVNFGTGHADRGFMISDRAVVQPVVWVTGRVVEFSVWGNVPLATNTDSSRPQILELELARTQGGGGSSRKLSIAPAVRMFFYHDPQHLYTSHSIEGWLYLSYGMGPFRLFSNQSLDLLEYRGAYFGEAGIAYERAMSPQLQVGGSFGAGWASARFNDAWADIAKGAFDRVSVTGSLTAHMNPRCYVGPHFEYSTILDRTVRTQLARPTFLLVGLTTGVEF